MSDAATYGITQGAGTLRDFLILLKPRVMSLVVFSGFAGMILAPLPMHPLLMIVALLCIALGSGGAGAINMWIERDRDALMRRTMHRPLPQGRMDPQTALEFGSVMAVGSVLLMGLAVNALAAGLLAMAILFYVFIYTIWLKPRTPQNIVIGGAAGAFPPLIGWAAATGEIGLPAIVLFLIIFFWTPPHFWALALFRNEDYRRAGIPMLPVVAGARATQGQMLAYTLVLLPLAIAPFWIGLAGVGYAIGAALLGLGFVSFAVAVLLDKTDRAAKGMFAYSLFYLSALLSLLILDRLGMLS